VKRNTSPLNAKGLTLRTRMLMLSAVAFVGMLIVTVISLCLINSVRIGGPAYKTIRKDMDALESIALLKSNLYQINTEVQNVVQETDKVAVDKKIAFINGLTGDIDLNFCKVMESVELTNKLESINKAKFIWSEYKKTLLEDILTEVNKGNGINARTLISGIQTERFNTFIKAVAPMVETIRQDVYKAEEMVSASIRTKIVISVLVTLLLIGLISIFSYVITESITKPLRACVDFARSVANGRLDARLTITSGGEIGALASAMNTMAENLHSMVTRVSSATEILTSIDNNIEKAARQVVSSAHLQETVIGETSQAVERINESDLEVSNGVEELSSSASETSVLVLEMAASIEEVALNADKLGNTLDEASSSIMEMAASIKQIGASIVNLLDASTTTASAISEMDATIKQVEKNAMDTAAISEGVKYDAEIGKKASEEAIAGMQAIRSSSHITAEVIENLSLRANDIGAILSVIDEVADQTNLLALNAAIIAAQAGEHGKGFAVVADEIRELSERTSSSTREIAAVIQGVQDETRRAVDAINRAEDSISEGEKLSQRSGTALEKIVSGVQKASGQIREIARATVEQARGSQSIKEAMESVEEMVGHIAQSSVEHSKGSELIAAAVERIKDLSIHVRTSTREQSRAGNLIANSTGNITTMIDRIRDGCQKQRQSSAMFAKAVANIQLSSVSNSESAKVLEVSVTGLTKQIELLDKEMSGFSI